MRGGIRFTACVRHLIPCVYPLLSPEIKPPDRLHLTHPQVPADGPAGQLLQLMDRHPFRPAHIHLVVRHAKYKHLTTQIFDKDCKYLADDSVFAVKDELSVRFAPRKGDALAGLELEYDISLAPVS